MRQPTGEPPNRPAPQLSLGGILVLVENRPNALKERLSLRILLNQRPGRRIQLPLGNKAAGAPQTSGGFGTGRGRPSSSIATKVKVASVTFSWIVVRKRRAQAST